MTKTLAANDAQGTIAIRIKVDSIFMLGVDYETG